MANVILTVYLLKIITFKQIKLQTSNTTHLKKYFNTFPIFIWFLHLHDLDVEIIQKHVTFLFLLCTVRVEMFCLPLNLHHSKYLTLIIFNIETIGINYSSLLNLLSSQVIPFQPVVQQQVNEFIPSIHVPPFSQGSGAHSLATVKRIKREPI